MSLFLAGVGLQICPKLRGCVDPQDVGFEIRRSAVHTAKGDLVLPGRRLSQQCVGNDTTVFELLQSILPEGFEVVRGHYDVVHYGEGGHFARHKDFVPVTAPGLTWWHGLLCLEAPEQGGQTRIFGGETAEEVKWAVGDVLLLAGAEHEGLEEKAGHKTLLKFDAWQFQCHGKLQRYTCTDGSVRLPDATLRRSSFFERLLHFEKDYTEHSLASLTLMELAAVYAYLGGAADAADPLRLHELLGWLCCPEAALSPTSFSRLQMCNGAAATQTSEGALTFAEMALQDFYELFVVLRRAEYVTEEGRTQYTDRGLLLLSSTGKPLFSTGGSWLGPSASRAFRSGDVEPRPQYALEPPLPVLEGNTGFNGLEFTELEPEEVSEVEEGIPHRWLTFASSKEEAPVVAVGAAALRAVLQAQESSWVSQVPDDNRPHPNPIWCQKMEAVVLSVCDSFDEFDCNGGNTAERSIFEYCNDGDGYYASQYVTSVFAVDWLLCRREA